MNAASEPDRRPKVAIVVVSYNALSFARKMLKSVRRTTGVDIEIVVVDNHSGLRTRLYWTAQRFLGRISRLALLDTNTFFAEGNNIGVAMAPRDATHILLLNTDCEVLDPAWLRRMLAVHKEGATGLRYVINGAWPRADGFCLLVDRHCWENGLDESYQWWWSITGLEARLLRQGLSVQAVQDYERVVVHHRGKSGKAFTKATSGDTRDEVIAGWFEGRHVTVVDRLPDLA
jgi:glycosyltransferase involved in cell wall biosynthesis